MRRILGKSGHFAIAFRKDLWGPKAHLAGQDRNAKRALEKLSGAELNGHRVSATLRALELSRQSRKVGLKEGS